jgi:hypothetical protein
MDAGELRSSWIFDDQILRMTPNLTNSIGVHNKDSIHSLPLALFGQESINRDEVIIRSKE